MKAHRTYFALVRRYILAMAVSCFVWVGGLIVSMMLSILSSNSDSAPLPAAVGWIIVMAVGFLGVRLGARCLAPESRLVGALLLNGFGLSILYFLYTIFTVVPTDEVEFEPQGFWSLTGFVWPPLLGGLLAAGWTFWRPGSAELPTAERDADLSA